jgi:hypothetical protein
MRGKIMFLGGLAVGFVLGARAGREKYEELVVQGRKVLDHPTVQEAAGVAQAQANRLYAEGKDRISHSKLGEKLSTGNGDSHSLTSADQPYAGTPATVGAKTGSGSTSSVTGSSTSAGSTTGKSKSPGTGTNGSTI